MSANIVHDISVAGNAAFFGNNMRFSGSSDNNTRRASARHRFPPRRLHLVDVENLVGDRRPSLDQVCRARNRYEARLAFGAMDQVEVASSHLALVNAALGWPHAHYRARSGPDGADQALLDVLRYEDVADRFSHVVIGSGDHLFAEEAARLAAQDVWVTVVSRWRSLSRRLQLAAHEVIFLDTPAKAA
jgi:hypothetical protein